MTKLRRGFVKEADAYALDFRSELGKSASDPLHAFELAEHLCVPLTALSTHPTIPDDVKRFYMLQAKRSFSAATLTENNYCEILYNDFCSETRQNSDIIHELAHIILGHESSEIFDTNGHRKFNAIDELEANTLGWTILIPKLSALYAVQNFANVASAASYFGVSKQLMELRIRKSDARRWAQNKAKKQMRLAKC